MKRLIAVHVPVPCITPFLPYLVYGRRYTLVSADVDKDFRAGSRAFDDLAVATAAVDAAAAVAVAAWCRRSPRLSERRLHDEPRDWSKEFSFWLELS